MVQEDPRSCTAPPRSKWSRFHAICFLPWTLCCKISAVCPDIAPTSSCHAEPETDSQLQASSSMSAHNEFASQNPEGLQSKSCCTGSLPILANGQALHPLINADGAPQHDASPGTPAWNPVAVQVMSNRSLDLLSSIQITCPQCWHSFQYRLSASERIVAASGRCNLSDTSCFPQP